MERLRKELKVEKEKYKQLSLAEAGKIIISNGLIDVLIIIIILATVEVKRLHLKLQGHGKHTVHQLL